MKTLEKLTNLSSEQIANLHAPVEKLSDPDNLKAVVIEVAESEVAVEEIVVEMDSLDEPSHEAIETIFDVVSTETIE
jgi:hypothetical protein